MRFLEVLVAIAGGVLVVAVIGSVLRTLVVPRGTSDRIAGATSWIIDTLTQLMVRARRGDAARERLLAAQAPIYLLSLLITWLLLLAAAFSALLLPATGSVRVAVDEAVSSLLTLGFTKTVGSWVTGVDFVAAGSGLLTVALLVGYLPTIYGAYNRRETEVTLLDSRAGSPPWGPELLARTRVGIQAEDELDQFYRGWERWAADVAETHATYPVLVRFRSPNPATHWTVAVLSVLDSAALFHAVAPSRAPASARLALRMGFQALREIATTLDLPFDPDPMPDAPIELSRAEFDDALGRLRDVGFRLERDDDEAWVHFRGWRVNYESIAYTLCSRTDAVPARWSGPRRRATVPIPPRRPLPRTPERPDGVTKHELPDRGVLDPDGSLRAPAGRPGARPAGPSHQPTPTPLPTPTTVPRE